MALVRLALKVKVKILISLKMVLSFVWMILPTKNFFKCKLRIKFSFGGVGKRRNIR